MRLNSPFLRGTCYFVVAHGRPPPASAPALGHAPVGDLRLLDAASLLLAGSRQIVGVGGPSLAASRRLARAQFQVAQLLGMQRRAHPGVVLTAREQVPDDDDVLDNVANFGVPRTALTSPDQPGTRPGRHPWPPQCA